MKHKIDEVVKRYEHAGRPALLEVIIEQDIEIEDLKRQLMAADELLRAAEITEVSLFPYMCGKSRLKKSIAGFREYKKLLQDLT